MSKTTTTLDVYQFVVKHGDSKYSRLVAISSTYCRLLTQAPRRIKLSRGNFSMDWEGILPVSDEASEQTLNCITMQNKYQQEMEIFVVGTVQTPLRDGFYRVRETNYEKLGVLFPCIWLRLVTSLETINQLDETKSRVFGEVGKFVKIDETALAEDIFRDLGNRLFEHVKV